MTVSENNAELLAYMKEQDEAATLRRRTRNRAWACVACLVAVVAGVGWAVYASGSKERERNARTEEVSCRLLGRPDC